MGDRFENTAEIVIPALDDYIRTVTKTGGTRRALASELAKKIVEEYEGSSLGGEERTIQAAIADAKQVASEALEEEQTAREDADTAINTDLAKKAYADGEYADLHAGTANQILSDTYTTDEEPYHYRQTPSHAGTREMDEIVGGSVVWNQLVENGNFESASGWRVYGGASVGSLSVADNTATITYANTTASSGGYNYGLTQQAPISPVVGHKYFVQFDAFIDFSGKVGIEFENELFRKAINSNEWTRVCELHNSWGATTSKAIIIKPVDANGTIVSGSVMKIKNAQLIDLTAMLTPTIADHIYALEQATAGAGVAFFRKYFPEEYYAFNAGTMRSVEGLVSHDTVGFNLFDKATVTNNSWLSTSTGLVESGYNDFAVSDYIRVLKGVDIYIPDLGSARRWFYTNDKKPHTYIGRSTAQIFTPPQDGYIRVTINKTTNNINDICINISNTAKNGQYEPYSKHSYAIDSTVTLRGIPQLVDGKLKFDGDTYESDGTVTRRYGIVDLGTLNWSHDNGDNIFRLDSDIGAKKETKNVRANIICSKYPTVSQSEMGNASADKIIAGLNWSYGIRIKDTGYSTSSDFKTAMSGVMLVYKLATPTTEQAEPYQELQICSPYGTEEYVSTSIVPIGHYTKYPTDLKGIVEQIADAPSADGTYTLKATVSNGVVTYSWESVNG